MTNIINGIDVSEYFIEVVDEGGSTIDYKILPNSERLLVEKIFEQNQQLKRLQQELDIKEKMLDKFMIGSGETLEKLQKENEGLKSLNDFNVQKIEVLQEENEELKAENEQLKKPCLIMPKVKQLAVPIEKYEKLYKALEKIIDIAEKLITETPEYNSCYYKDECGDNCTPKKQSKVEYCCYENVDKILTIIDEVLNDRD